MARVNIYVPADLKARMDTVRRSTNWSEVVRPAILSAVASDEQRKGANMKTPDLNAVVERKSIFWKWRSPAESGDAFGRVKKRSLTSCAGLSMWLAAMTMTRLRV